MRCGYLDHGLCRSCTLIEQPYPVQLAGKQAAVAALLGDRVPTWDPPQASREAAFRNKAKMVVGGTAAEPTLGILDPRGHGVDLRGCGLHEPVLTRALGPLAQLVSRSGLVPYDVPGRRGELKHVLVTASPDGELMVRFVLRSEDQLPRLREHLPWLREQLPHLRVVSANLQPEHKAVLEGEREVLLGLEEVLEVRLAGLELLLRPQGFLQTNSAVAAALYEQARAWVDDVGPRSVWDLYCGVGGFALALAGPGRDVLGVEISEEAVAGAREAARRAGLDGVRFEAGNATTLVRDLDAMPSLAVVRARVFDMFPQSRHHEVVVLLERR